MKTSEYKITIDEKEETQRGELLATVLGLKKTKEGRYNTLWGTKSDLGLYRTVKRLVEEGE